MEFQEQESNISTSQTDPQQPSIKQYSDDMIKSFNCRETERIFNGMRSKKFPTDIQKRAFQKLAMLDAAETVDDLRIPPSNNLESLSGDRRGQWSISVNHKYRICFTWSDKEANNVEIVEYH